MTLTSSTPSDAEARRRFRVEIDRSFSVIAPAGVGKTHALVERIATLAECRPQALSGLVVITYTKKAANSLKGRIYERLQHNGDAVRALLNQSFFGTIHSFCWQVIQKFDENAYELLRDDTDIRERFLGSLNLEEPDFARFQNLFRFLDVDELLETVPDAGFGTWWNEKTGDTAISETEADRSKLNFPPASSERTCSKQPQAVETNKPDSRSNVQATGYPQTNGGGCALDVSPIFGFRPKRKDPRALANIEATKRSLKEWLSLYRDTQRPLDLPTCDVGGKEFKEVFRETFRPFYERLTSEAVACGRLLKERYATFRCECGYLTHDDSILSAQRCLQTDEAKTFYRNRPITVLLDEAQDTDRAQFDFLQKLVSLHPNSGFSMVGDPQQSIYGGRADVRYYLSLHQSLLHSKRCEELIFSETFRCPPAVVSELNARFPGIFRDPEGKQVSYVPLCSALQNDGCVKEIAVPYEKEVFPSKEEAAVLEAKVLSDFLTDYLKQNPRNLSDVCLLAPRNEWLTELKQPLETFGWKLQLHSEQTTGRDNALFCNCLAANHCINFPQDTFEEAGLLRETFGCSDEALAYAFARDRKRGSNDDDGTSSEKTGNHPSSIDVHGYPKCDGLGSERTSSVFGKFQGGFSVDGDNGVSGEMPLHPFFGSEGTYTSSQKLGYVSGFLKGSPPKFSLNSATVTNGVEAAEGMRHCFRQLLNEISEQSLCAGTVRLIEFFKPLVPPMPTDAYFEDVLTEAAFQTQCLGQSRLALEQRLRASLTQKAETEFSVQSDALQGFSCHKAKGLEWKTVIMPFFDRPVRYPPPESYPYVWRGCFLWCKADWEEAAIASERRRELQRLLYVACTRTKEHLFLFRDRDLWKPEAAFPSSGVLYDAGNV